MAERGKKLAAGRPDARRGQARARRPGNVLLAIWGRETVSELQLRNTVPCHDPGLLRPPGSLSAGCLRLQDAGRGSRQLAVAQPWGARWASRSFCLRVHKIEIDFGGGSRRTSDSVPDALSAAQQPSARGGGAASVGPANYAPQASTARRFRGHASARRMAGGGSCRPMAASRRRLILPSGIAAPEGPGPAFPPSSFYYVIKE
jgi:hypothetical protein